MVRRYGKGKSNWEVLANLIDGEWIELSDGAV